jgi:hypothetical protein
MPEVRTVTMLNGSAPCRGGGRLTIGIQGVRWAPTFPRTIIQLVTKRAIQLRAQVRPLPPRMAIIGSRHGKSFLREAQPRRCGDLISSQGSIRSAFRRSERFFRCRLSHRGDVPRPRPSVPGGDRWAKQIGHRECHPEIRAPWKDRAGQICG